MNETVEYDRPKPPTELGVGSEFGPYKVLRLLGEGAYGAVYEAVKSPLKKRVALKILHRSWANSPKVVERFIREAKAAASLRHPHIVDVDELGALDGIPWIAMEYLEGQSLAERLKELGRFSIETTLDYLIPIFSAVAAIHAKGIIHRDLKPENIHLWQGSAGTIHPKLLDFGIAKVTQVEDGHSITGATDVMGTPEYMAPEQWKSAKTVSSASDQWALAIIVYKLVTGISPFRAENAQGIMFRVASESIAPFGPELSAFGGFEKALAKALEKDPANRYRSVRAFTAALLPFASQGTQQRWMNEFIGDLATDPAPIMTQMLSDLPPPLASSVKPPASSQPPASKARPALSDSLAASEQQIDVRPLSRFSVRYGLLGAAITIAAVVGVATKVFVHRSSSQLQTYDAGLPSHLTAASPTTNPTAIIATGETADGAGLSYDAAVTLHQDAGVHHSHLGHHDGASAEHQGTSTVNPGTPAPPGRTPIGTGLPESPNI